MAQQTPLHAKEVGCYPPRAKCCLIIQIMKPLVLMLLWNYCRKGGEEEIFGVFFLLRVTKHPLAGGQPVQPEVSYEDLGWEAVALSEMIV